MTLLSVGHFGHTQYDCLEIRVNKRILGLRIDLDNDVPEYLNLTGVEFWNKSKLIDLNSLDVKSITQSSKYVKNSDANPNAVLELLGVHTLKELQPYIEINFEKSIPTDTIKVFNRNDYWAKRSKNLRSFALFEDSLEWILLCDLKSKAYHDETNYLIAKTLPLLSHDHSGTGLLPNLADLTKGNVSEFINTPWPLIIKAFPIWDKSPSSITDNHIYVTAAYLLVQGAQLSESSFLSIGKPFLSTHAISLQIQLTKLAELYELPNINLEELLNDECQRKKDRGIWHELKELSETLTLINPSKAQYHYNLGLANEKLGFKEDALESYKSALTYDADADDIHLTLLHSTFESMECRVELANFIISEISGIQNRAEAFKPKYENRNYKIFSYWAQGITQAPAIVKACHRQLYKFHQTDEIVYLDDTNYRYYVDIPHEIIDKVGHNKTFFSDILRFFLLCEYGGTWIDSTCYLTAPLDVDYNTVEHNKITAFRRANKTRISAWFFSCSQSSYIARLMKESLLSYWSKYDRAIDYFILHHIFEILYFLDPKFQAEWDHHDQPLTSEAHRWYFKQQEPFNIAEYQKICSSSPIHKLTYKVDGKIFDSNNFYSFAIRGF